jgi:hypothetical protein
VEEFFSKSLRASPPEQALAATAATMKKALTLVEYTSKHTDKAAVAPGGAPEKLPTVC